MNIRRLLKRVLKPGRYYPHVNNTAYIGANVKVYNKEKFIMDEHTGIGNNSIIMNKYANFIIHRYSGISINLVAVTGNHPMIVGRFYRTISKINDHLDISKYDKDIVIDEDAWTGANVTLLSGVHIGRGAIVAAGAVVTKSMPPYCICGGVPAKVLKFKWTIGQVLEHESKLYPEEQRFTRAELDKIFSEHIYMTKI